MSRSGEMYRPCSVISSPVLTIAVTSAGATTCTTPSRKRAAPTPPARVTIIRFLIIYRTNVVLYTNTFEPALAWYILFYLLFVFALAERKTNNIKKKGTTLPQATSPMAHVLLLTRVTW